jgi:hypothetical protein
VIKKVYLALIEIVVAVLVLGSFFAFWQAGTGASNVQGVEV